MLCVVLILSVYQIATDSSAVKRLLELYAAHNANTDHHTKDYGISHNAVQPFDWKTNDNKPTISVRHETSNISTAEIMQKDNHISQYSATHMETGNTNRTSCDPKALPGNYTSLFYNADMSDLVTTSIKGVSNSLAAICCLPIY
jgi:hypothetical protein